MTISPATDLRDTESPIRGEYIAAMKQADLRNYGPLIDLHTDNDPKTAEILSKVLLLARDQEIQDPTILAQLGAPPIQRAQPTMSATLSR